MTTPMRHTALAAAALLAALLVASAPAEAAQTCPADYPRTTPNSDFSAAGAGMVQHTPSGLIWKRCAEGQTWDAGTSTCTGAADSYTWQAAFTRVAAVNAGTTGENLGHTDWRLPNINELQSLAELGCVGPAINLTQFPNTPASNFWSASPDASNSDGAWGVDFNYGDDDWGYRDGAFRVRLVRAGQSFSNFDALRHAIATTASPSAGGTVTCTPNPVPNGQSSTCTATANAGYSFSAFSGDCSGSACTLSNVTSPRGVTALFEEIRREYTGPLPGEGDDDPTQAPAMAAVTLSGGGARCGFEQARFISVTALGAMPPPGQTFPLGLFDFQLTACTPGATVTLHIDYPEPLPAGARYWKYGPTPDDHNPHWYPMAAEIAGNRVSFSITDGAVGDSDLRVDGRISDPSGPTGPAPVAIPTLSQWGLLLLGGLLFYVGGRRLRRVPARG